MAASGGRLDLVKLLIARNPEPESSLPYLMLVPIGDGLVFRTKGTWPRTAALYCHPVPRTEWPAEPELVEEIPLRACARRGAAIDIVADRSREHRSQLVFTIGPWPGDGVLAGAAYAQAGPAGRARPGRAGVRRRRAGDPGRRP